MRVTEKLVKSPEEEGVTLAYIRLTKDFEEIKEYVQHKGDTLTGYKKARERASIRIEDIQNNACQCRAYYFRTDCIERKTICQNGKL